MLRSLSAFLMARFYDRAMQRTEQLCLQSWRAALLSKAVGQTLEIGAGTGANLRHYPPDCILLLSEPDRHMRRRLGPKIHKGNPVSIELYDWAAEAIPLPEASFDTIVSTLVLCSVANLQQCSEELFRLLRPGGRLLFIEHVLAEQPRLAGWQRRLTPFWRCCCGNCHLDRDTIKALSRAGFQFAELTEAPLLGAPAIVRRSVRGLALKPVDEKAAKSSQELALDNLPPCPICGGNDIAQIIYGKPPLTRQVLAGLESGRILSGGCLVHNGAPEWYCFSCRQDFGHHLIVPTPQGEPQ